MKEFVVAPEVYLAGTMTGGGPAAELFRLAYALKGKVVFVLSPWVENQIVLGMQEAGYDLKTSKEQVDFIVQLHKLIPVPNEGDDPLVDLAKEVGVNEIYAIGERVEAEVDGVRFVSIGELLELLRGMS